MKFRAAGRSLSHDLLPPDEDTRFLDVGRMMEPGFAVERPVSTSGPIRETAVRVETRISQAFVGETRGRAFLVPSGSWQFGSGPASTGVPD